MYHVVNVPGLYDIHAGRPHTDGSAGFSAAALFHDKARIGHVLNQFNAKPTGVGAIILHIPRMQALFTNS